MKQFINTIKVGLLSLIVVAFTSCKTAAEKNQNVHSAPAEGQEQEGLKKLNFSSVSKGVLFGNGEEGFEQGVYPIRSADEWKKFAEKINSVNPVESEQKEIADNEMLIACFSKIHSTGGVSFEINAVHEHKNKIVVRMRAIPPSGMATTVLTQPYEIISINASDKEISYELIP